jgi:hypothetical protein
MKAIPLFFEINLMESMKRVEDDTDSLILSMTMFDPSRCLDWVKYDYQARADEMGIL